MPRLRPIARSSRMSAIVLSALVALPLCGCQSQPKDVAAGLTDSQSIAIDTPGAPGAQCSLKSVVVGHVTVTTPAHIEVDRSPEIIVVLCRKACYLDASAMIASEGQRRADGSVVYSYPAETKVQMTAAGSCNAPSSPGGGASPL